MSATQKQTIIELLNAAEWVCGTVFQTNYIPEYRTRINELRKDNFTIDARRCAQHQHKGMMQEWQLVKYSKSDTVQYHKVAESTVPDESLSTEPNIASQPTGNYAYYPPEKPKACCEIWERSKYMHSRGCVNAQN